MTSDNGSRITVSDEGTPLSFGYEDLMRYHGPGYPGGVAHAFKVLERALPVLSPDQPARRRAIAIRTCFTGPGARDGFEAVTRAVTEGRYEIDPAMARPERGMTLERYVFRVSHGTDEVTLTIREGLVTEEFIRLARKPDRTEQEELHLAVLKREMADRLLGRPATEVYDVEQSSH